MRWRSLLRLSLASVLVLSGVVSASAAALPPRPPGVPSDTWAALMGPTPSEWAPQGTVVADSGFEAWRDSFSFFNYGLGVGFNEYLGYRPDANTYFFFTNDDLPALFGRDVGCTAVVKGRCIANPIASMLAKAWTFGVMGGHCYGMAGVASQLFNREINPRSFTDSYATYGMRLDEKLGRVIAIAWAKQFSWLSDPAQKAKYTFTGREAINTLKRGLRDGKSPYILAFFFEGGGHAITPTAVRDRGNGQFDIVVYDNNYPLRERAVHVDTIANTWEYQVSTSPGSGDVIARGDATSANLQLVPVSTLKDKVPCVPCEETSAGRTWVQFANTKGKTQITLVGLDGKPIPGVIDVKPTDYLAVPGYSVPKGVPFRLIIDNTARSEKAVTEVFTYPEGRGIDTLVTTEPGAVSDVVVNPKGELMQIVDQRADITLALDTGKSDSSAQFVLSPRGAGPRPESRQELMASTVKRGIMEVAVTGGSRQRLTGSVLRVDKSGAAAPGDFGKSQRLILRPGDRIRLNVGTWKGSAQELKAHVIRSNGNRVRVVISPKAG